MEQTIPSLKSFVGIDARPNHTLEHCLHNVNIRNLERDLPINPEIPCLYQKQEWKKPTYLHWAAAIIAALSLGAALCEYKDSRSKSEVRAYILERTYR